MNELFKIAVTADVGGFVQNLAKAENAAQSFGAVLQGVANMGKAMGETFGLMARVVETSAKHVRNWGIAGIATATGWTIAAASFETGMRNVNALIGLNSRDFQKMTDQVLWTAAKFPQAISQSSAGFYQIVSAGYQKPAEALTILQSSLRAASAGVTDTATAAGALVGALHAYGMEASNASQVSDILFQEVNLGVNSFGDLAQGMGEWVNIAASAGVPLRDAAQALATITRAGNEPAEAATQLARTIQQFVKPTQDMTRLAVQFGYTTPLAMLQAKGLAGAMQLIQQSTGGSIEAMSGLFDEIRGLRGALALVSAGGSNFAQVLQQWNQNGGEAGATMRAFAAQSEGAAFKFNILKNGIQAGSIQLGNYLLPVVKSVENALIPIVTTPMPNFLAPLVAYGTGFGGIAAAVVGGLTAWQAKAAVTATAFHFLGQKLSVLAKADWAAKIPNASRYLEVLATAANNAGSSIIRFTLNAASGFVQKVPIIGSAVAKLTTNFERLKTVGLVGAGIATAALAAVVAINTVQKSLDAISDKWRNFYQQASEKFPMDNLQQINDGLREQGKLLDQDIQKTSTNTKGLGNYVVRVAEAVGGAIPIVGDFIPQGGPNQLLKNKEAIAEINREQDKAISLQGLYGRVASQAYSDAYNRGVKLGGAIHITTDELVQLAAQSNIPLFDESGHISEDTIKSISDKLQGYIDTWGRVPKVSGSSIEQQIAQLDDLKKAADQTMQGVQKAFSQYDVLDKFDNKYFEDKFTSTSSKKSFLEGFGHRRGDFKNIFNIDQLKSYYSDAVGDTQQFLTDIQTAIKQGFDPNFIAELMQAGPSKASDFLHTAVTDTTGQMKALINFGEGALSELAAQAAEAQRMITIASAPGASLDITRDLSKAMKVGQILIAQPKISQEDLIKQTGFDKATLERLGQEYNITIPARVTLDPTLDKEGYFSDLQKIMESLPDINSQMMTQIGPDTLAQILTGTVPFQAGLADTTVGNLDMQSNKIKDRIANTINTTLKGLGIKLPKVAVDLLVSAAYKGNAERVINDVLGTTGLRGEKKTEAYNLIVGLIGDKDAFGKLTKFQNQLKLTPQQLFMAMHIDGDEAGQRKVLEWVAKVNHVNVNDIKVKFDQTGVPHFFKNVDDAQKGINELNTSEASPVIDANTGKFMDDIAVVNGELVKLSVIHAVPIQTVINTAGLDSFESRIRALQGLHVNVPVQTSIVTLLPSPGKGPANGGFLKFALGGLADEYHNAEIAKPGTWRLWAEPETGGEAYIPLGQNKRVRSLHILDQVAKHFGYRMEKLAEGGLIESYDAGGIVSSITNREFQISSDYYRFQNSPAMQMAIASATQGIDKSKDLLGWTKAAQQAGLEVARTYEEVKAKAGSAAAATLMNAHLVGQGFTDAAQKIMDEVDQMDTVMANKLQMGAISDKAYTDYLNGRLAKTERFSQEWMDLWTKIQDFKIDRAAQQFALGMTWRDQYEKFLQGLLATYTKFSAEWTKVHDQLKQLQDEDRQRMQDIQDTQFNMGTVSPEQHIQQLRQRQANIREPGLRPEQTAEYWQIQAQIQKEQQDLMAARFQNKDISADAYARYLHDQIGHYKKYSQQWMDLNNQLKQVQEQASQHRLNIAKHELDAGRISTQQYVSMLRDRQLAFKKNSDEWLQMQDQIDQIRNDFKKPILTATDIATGMSGKSSAFGGAFSKADVQAFFASTIGASKEFLAGLKHLQSLGLDQTTLEEIAKGGPANLPLVRALISEGPKGIQWVNQQEKNARNIATQTADLFSKQVQTPKKSKAEILASGDVHHAALTGIAAGAQQVMERSGATTSTQTTHFNFGAITIGAGNNVTKTDVQTAITSALNDMKVEIEHDLSQGVK